MTNTEPTSTANPGPQRHRARSGFSIVFGVLGVVGVLVSVLGVWANRVLFESDSVGNAVEQALLQPEVTDALAVYLTDQILAAVDVEELVAEKLPPNLSPLSPVIAGGARTVVQEAFERALAAEATREVIVAATERAHQRAMQVLEGGSLADGANVEDGSVSLNLLAIIGNGLVSLQDAGLLTRVDLPDLDPSADPALQIAQLEDAIGRDLPDDFGQVVVYESEQLAAAQVAVARAQQALVLFRQALIGILVVTVACLVGSVLLAVRRRRSLIILSLGVVAAMGLGRALVRTIVEEVPTLALKPGSRSALTSMVESLSTGLINAVTLALGVGLVVAAIAFLTGSSPTVVALRGRVSSTGSSLSGVVAEHRDGVALTAFALAVLVVAVFGFSTVPLIVGALLAAGGMAALLLVPAPSARP